ncbi:ferritin-like domain-containing protein [Lysinibacillus fusiformis]
MPFDFTNEHLAQLVPNSEIRDRILEIRNDEIRHYQGFSYIYTCITGQQPCPQITEQLPTNFKSGVITTFEDEQEAAEFYLGVAREPYTP